MAQEGHPGYGHPVFANKSSVHECKYTPVTTPVSSTATRKTPAHRGGTVEKRFNWSRVSPRACVAFALWVVSRSVAARGRPKRKVTLTLS